MTATASEASDSAREPTGNASTADAVNKRPEQCTATLLDVSAVESRLEEAREALRLFIASAQQRAAGPSLNKALHLGRCLLRVQRVLNNDVNNGRRVEAFLHELGMGSVVSMLPQTCASSAARKHLDPGDRVVSSGTANTTHLTNEQLPGKNSPENANSLRIDTEPYAQAAVSDSMDARTLRRAVSIAILRSFSAPRSVDDYSASVIWKEYSWASHVAFLRKPSVQQAESLIRPDLNSLGAYTIIMSSLLRAGCDQAVLVVFDLLTRRKGETLDIIVYNIAAQAMARLGQVERVLELITTMMRAPATRIATASAAPRCEPDWITWRSAIEACLRRRDVHAAWTMYTQATTYMRQRAPPEQSAMHDAQVGLAPLSVQRVVAAALSSAGQIAPLLQMLHAWQQTAHTDPADTCASRTDPQDAGNASMKPTREHWCTQLAMYALQAIRQAALRVHRQRAADVTAASAGSCREANTVMQEWSAVVDSLQQAYVTRNEEHPGGSVHGREAERTAASGPVPEIPISPDALPPVEYVIQARCALRQAGIVWDFVQEYRICDRTDDGGEYAETERSLHESTVLAILEMAAAQADVARARQLYAHLERRRVGLGTRAAAVVYLANALVKDGNWQEAWSMVQSLSGFDPVRRARDRHCLRGILDACGDATVRQEILESLGLGARDVDTVAGAQIRL